MKEWLPPRALILSWLGLLALLALTVIGAYLPLVGFNTPFALAIAAIKALLVVAIFMEVRKASSLVTVFAGAGAFWLFLILWLAFADYMTRQEFPNRGGSVFF